MDDRQFMTLDTLEASFKDREISQLKAERDRYLTALENVLAAATLDEAQSLAAGALDE